MTSVWIEYKDGNKEEVDSADSESEALILVDHYRSAFKHSAARVWVQESEVKESKDLVDREVSVQKL